LASNEDGYTFAVIGDIPYGDAAIARFPANVAQINADPAVQWVDHLGDIKNGSSVCSDAYFQLIKRAWRCSPSGTRHPWPSAGSSPSPYLMLQ